MMPGLSMASLFASSAAAALSGPVGIHDDAPERVVVSPASATALWTLSAGGGVTGTNIAAYDWLQTGSADAYEVSFDGGASWLGLGSNRSINLTRTSVGSSSKAYDVRIRLAATKAEVARATITLIVEVSL